MILSTQNNELLEGKPIKHRNYHTFCIASSPQKNVVLVSGRIRLAPKTKVPCATREHHQVMSSDDDISFESQNPIEVPICFKFPKAA